MVILRYQFRWDFEGVTIQASPWIHPFGHQPFLLGDIPMKHTQRLRFLGRELKVQMVDSAPFDRF